MGEETINNIARARSFAIKCIKNRLHDLNSMDYYILQISKFILLKESMIVKDSKYNFLIFNYNADYMYVDAIERIAREFIKNSKEIIFKKIIPVHIYPHDKDNLDLQACIYVVHKLRDILAHGNYEIDFENERILIDNDTEDCRIKTSISLSTLESFSYTKESRFNDINQDRQFFNFNYKEHLEKSLGKSSKEVTPLPEGDIYNNENQLNSYENYDYKYDYEERKKQLEIIKVMLEHLIKIGIPQEQLHEIYESCKNLGLLKELSIMTGTVILNIPDTVEQASNIMRVRGSLIKQYQFVALYNYMQILLATKYDKLRVRRPEFLGHLKLSKICPKFTEKLKIDNDINNKVKEVIKRTNKAIKAYQNIPDNQKEHMLEVINNGFNDGIKEIFRLMVDRNLQVINGVRNATEHGHIGEMHENVVLFDLANQTDYKTINFGAHGTVVGLYKIMENIENEVLTPLTNFELLEELDGILDENTHKRFGDVILAIEELNNQKGY